MLALENVEAQMPPPTIVITNATALARIATNPPFSQPVTMMKLSWPQSLVWYKVQGSTNYGKSWFCETNLPYGTTNVCLPNRWVPCEWYRISVWYDDKSGINSTN